MIKTLTEYDFCREWETNEERKDQFTHSAQVALYEYLNECEEGTGQPVELDIIALCCEYTEYATAYEAMEQYQPEDMPVEGVEGDDLVEIQEKNEAEALRWLQERTQVIEFDGTVVLSDKTVLGDKGVIIAQF